MNPLTAILASGGSLNIWPLYEAYAPYLVTALGATSLVLCISLLPIAIKEAIRDGSDRCLKMLVLTIAGAVVSCLMVIAGFIFFAIKVIVSNHC